MAQYFPPWTKKPFWKSSCPPQEGVDYRILESAGCLMIRILEPRHYGTTYQYSRVSLQEYEGRGVLSYTYDLLSTENDGDLTKNPELDKIIGDILVSILDHGGRPHHASAGTCNSQKSPL